MHTERESRRRRRRGIEVVGVLCPPAALSFPQIIDPKIGTLFFPLQRAPQTGSTPKIVVFVGTMNRRKVLR